MASSMASVSSMHHDLDPDPVVGIARSLNTLTEEI